MKIRDHLTIIFLSLTVGMCCFSELSDIHSHAGSDTSHAGNAVVRADGSVLPDFIEIYLFDGKKTGRKDAYSWYGISRDGHFSYCLPAHGDAAEIDGKIVYDTDHIRSVFSYLDSCHFDKYYPSNDSSKGEVFTKYFVSDGHYRDGEGYVYKISDEDVASLRDILDTLVSRAEFCKTVHDE